MMAWNHPELNFVYYVSSLLGIRDYKLINFIGKVL